MSPSEFEVSVVVPVKNGMPWIEDQLKALSEQDFSGPWELIVSENGSTDGTKEALDGWKDHFGAFKVVDASDVRGPAAVRNAGVNGSSGACLAFCDADDVVSSGWLSGCLEALSGVEVAGGVFDFWSLNGLPAPHPAVPVVPPAKRQFGFLDAGLSSNLAVRREAFSAVGGFDEKLVVGEDTDLCWRLQLQGYRFRVADHAVVARRERSGLEQMFRRHLAYGACGPVLFKRHRASGLRRETSDALRSWMWLLASWPRLASRRDLRIFWIRIAAWRSGRLIGSVKEGVFFP